ncbi:leucyl aminopeptidase family protein [Loktanella sp. IMCC34160]|uniref:leucyl aminopeptidase family protein n=1 Tax=Loktanella sp. IMCC34160 TaxID=2510646 RepID=UPI00101C0EC7|nr:leucyl aminopeptidase family protein [Loktanella sp. IMCC34160]RYG89459.1 leucyl aminopeptidase family protein [Loktanella sp. IMCC34160]
MTPTFATDTETTIPLHAVAPDGLDDLLANLPDSAASWSRAQGFKAGSGVAIALPGPDGVIIAALVGMGAPDARARDRFQIGKAASTLPDGTYALTGDLTLAEKEEAALGWLLESYRFDRYKDQSPAKAALIAPDGIDAGRIETIAAGECLTRDLINTPAADMGPTELEAAARSLAQTFGAKVSSIVGEALIEQNFPLIHAVGRAAEKAPRLIDIRWGNEGPALTLVGKGICFDTGGLNIKPGSSMGLMKKDMGGAATVLGLAHMIMALGLKLRLRVLIPSAENNIAGNAFRPGDILTSRKGLTVEVNNTDAEGRLVLADALTYGAEEDPDLMVSFATLTGAARVAVGPDLAPFYATDDSHAAAITTGAAQVADPVWRMPFHAPYEAMIEPGIADLDNAPSGGFAGSITAALFLKRFAANPYVHYDIYGWCPTAKPGRPKGGVGQGARALLAALPDLLDL